MILGTTARLITRLSSGGNPDARRSEESDAVAK